VKTVKYFRSIERVQDEVEQTQAELKARGVSKAGAADQQVGSME
jgi:glucosamine-6-phosphate deaminase